jgi:hypothetical protein
MAVNIASTQVPHDEMQPARVPFGLLVQQLQHPQGGQRLDVCAAARAAVDLGDIDDADGAFHIAGDAAGSAGRDVLARGEDTPHHSGCLRDERVAQTLHLAHIVLFDVAGRDLDEAGGVG